MKRIGDLERKYVLDVLDGDFRTSTGAKYVNLLEKEFTKKIGSEFAVSFINGTATMHACLEAWNVGPGDEVIVPPLTMSSTTFAVVQCGATPVFADVDKDTFVIDTKSIEKKISSKTKAIIPVSLYGLSPDYDALNKLKEVNGIKVLGDHAECFLGKYNNRVVGSIDDAASFSFQSSKHLTSGEGGMVVTSDEEFAVKLRRIQSLGYIGVGKNAKIKKEDIQDPSYYRHGSLGWNYRMPELCAAVALAQTQRMEELVECRINAGKLFNQAVKEFSNSLTPQHTPKNIVNSYWTWVAKINDSTLWHDFKNLFISKGGLPFYGAWRLSYQEPFMQKLDLLRREELIENKHLEAYKKGGICPIAEDIQPRLMQFKTNFWNKEHAKSQADILFETCKEFF